MLHCPVAGLKMRNVTPSNCSPRHTPRVQSTLPAPSSIGEHCPVDSNRSHSFDLVRRDLRRSWATCQEPKRKSKPWAPGCVCMFAIHPPRTDKRIIAVLPALNQCGTLCGKILSAIDED